MDDEEKLADGDCWPARLQELSSHGFALAMQMLGNRDDAADAVQDALYTVLKKRRLFDPRRGELKPWFLRIVRNRCVDLMRGRARRPAAADDLAQVRDQGDCRPEVVAEERELRQLLRQQLMAMPPQQRELIFLRDYHNLSYAQIATVLSIPIGTVMSRLHRARMELRRRMQPYR